MSRLPLWICQSEAISAAQAKLDKKKKKEFRKQVLKLLQHHQNSERVYMNVEVVAADMLAGVITPNKRHAKQF